MEGEVCRWSVRCAGGGSGVRVPFSGVDVKSMTDALKL